MECIRFVNGVDKEGKCYGCIYNQGYSFLQGTLPCGQLSCWFSCEVCKHNKLNETCEEKEQ